MPYSQKELFIQVAEGNTRAFELLLQQYQSVIFGQAMAYLKSAPKAQDTVQEVFTAIWMKREKLKELENPEGYLFTIARNKIITELRRKLSSGMLDKIGQMQEQGALWTEKAFEEKQFFEQVQLAVNQLPPQQKKVFQLAKQQDLSYEEIARKLNISRETVKVHMVKALAFLRMRLRDLLIVLFLVIMFIFLN